MNKEVSTEVQATGHEHHRHVCSDPHHGQGQLAESNVGEVSTQAAAHDHHHHHHHHHHGHGHAQGQLAQANKEFFDNSAHKFDEWPRAKERGIRTALAIRQSVPCDTEKTSVLEFACGTGLVCKELLPYVKNIIGVDISQGVVDRFNDRFKENGTGDRCQAICANLETDNVLEGQKFDIVFCASAYHHFDSPETVTKTLASLLKPTGTFIIVDHLTTGSETIDDEHKHIVSRYGFVEDEIKKLYEGAGLQFDSFEKVPSDEEDKELFIAKGSLKLA